MKHQRKLKQFAREHDYCVGAFMAPGTGKTMPSIQLGLEHDPPYLVICRRDDYLTWELELAAEGVLEDEMYFIESGDDTTITALPWTIVTWDLLRNEHIQRWLKSIDFNVVIGDELHSIKRWAAQRTKAAIRSTRHIPHRMGLTGTPITNDARDAFSQCLFIDNGRTFGNNEWAFLKHYYIQDPKTNAWYPKADQKNAIRDRLRAMSYAVHEDDVLTLPPAKPVFKSAPMSGQQRRLYDQVVNDWELQLATGEPILLNYVMTQLQKLKQIASGFVYDQDHVPHRVRCPKLDLLCDLVTDKDYAGSAPKLIVWCSQTDEIDRISEAFNKLKISNTKFYGEMKPKLRHAARSEFRSNPKLRAFIAQVDAGVGMNELIIADTAFYYSNSLKVVSRQQSMRRNRRKGSEMHKRITYYDLVTEKSVDVKIARNISRSMSIAHYIVHGLKEGRDLDEVIHE